MLTEKVKKYALKVKNEDFIVKEIYLQPQFDALDNSQYTFLWVEKSGYTTFKIEQIIYDYFKVGIEDINCQGLKDEDAVTSQIISIKKILKINQINKFNNIYSKLKKSVIIKDIIGYGRYPVKERDLHGNCFEITIRKLDKKLCGKIYDFCNKNRFVSFVNYYDKQRFGMSGGPYNTHEIGKAIVENDMKRTLEELSKTKNSKDIKNFDKMLLVEPTFTKFTSLVGYNRVLFFINSYNSLIWNQVASKTISKKNQCTKMKFDEIGSLCLPKNEDFIAPQKIKSKSYFIDKEFKVREDSKQRNLIVQTAVYVSKCAKDEVYKNKYYISLSFFLPTGCYATMFIDQLIALADKNI